MKNLPDRPPVVTLALRLLLGGVFLWAGLGKLLSQSGGETLYRVFVGHSPVLHVTFCAGEILLGLWLVSGRGVQAAAGMASFVLLLFLGTLTYELLKAHPKPCGCGLLQPQQGLSVKTTLLVSLGGDVLLLCIAGALSGIGSRTQSTLEARAEG